MISFFLIFLMPQTAVQSILGRTRDPRVCFRREDHRAFFRGALGVAALLLLVSATQFRMNNIEVEVKENEARNSLSALDSDTR
jgi:hypothetical protein